MSIKELVYRNRSYRRYYQDISIQLETLRELIDLGRMSASALNRQPLKYHISNDPEKNAKVFSCIGWAGYLKDWPGPVEGERPSAYIIILGDTEISQHVEWDHSIAAQSILLGAADLGFGGCMIATIRRKELAELLELGERYQILLVIALGKPKENIVVEQLAPGGDVRYWRDNTGTHHVPKRALADIIL